MRCFVCGKNHEEHSCPVCGFPVIVIPGEGSIEDFIKQNQRLIDSYREKLLEKMKISVITNHWKEENDQYVKEKEDRIEIGSGISMYEKELWCEQKFARIQGDNPVNIRFAIDLGTSEESLSVDVPNINEVGFQEVGVSIVKDFKIIVYLRNNTKTVHSEETAIFN